MRFLLNRLGATTSVWCLNHYAITPDRLGGARHLYLAGEFTRRGYGVTIFASASWQRLWRAMLRAVPQRTLFALIWRTWDGERVFPCAREG